MSATTELGCPNREPCRILGFPSFQLKFLDVFRERGREGSARERKGFKENDFFFSFISLLYQGLNAAFCSLKNERSVRPPACDPDPTA